MEVPTHGLLTEQQQQQQQQLLRLPTDRRQTSWLFTRAARTLNKGLPGTNLTSGKNES